MFRCGRHLTAFLRSSKGTAAATSKAISAGLLLSIVLSWEKAASGEVTCDSGEVATKSSMSRERSELRRVALAHLTKSVRAFSQDTSVSDIGDDGVEDRSRGVQPGERGVEVDGKDEGAMPLPHLYDVDRILAKTPLRRNNHAFHDTLNSDDAISCPYVLSRPGQEGPGIEAVVRFGKSIAGHPNIVHGGVTALTFDNLFGMALFLQNSGAVFTAFIKVDYKAPLPCLTTAIVDVTVDRREGRKLYVTGRLKSLDGTVTFSSAEALFIKPKEGALGGRSGIESG